MGVTISSQLCGLPRSHASMCQGGDQFISPASKRNRCAARPNDEAPGHVFELEPWVDILDLCQREFRLALEVFRVLIVRADLRMQLVPRHPHLALPTDCLIGLVG